VSVDKRLALTTPIAMLATSDLKECPCSLHINLVQHPCCTRLMWREHGHSLRSLVASMAIGVVSARRLSRLKKFIETHLGLGVILLLRRTPDVWPFLIDILQIYYSETKVSFYELF
jgi:hypothetical protein